MAGMVAALSEQDMKDLAAYFSSQTMKEGSTPEDVVAKGEKLFRGGDLERGIAACIACHGPRGVGHSLAGFLKFRSNMRLTLKLSWSLSAMVHVPTT